MNDFGEFVGIVTGIVDEYNFIFHSDKDTRCQIQQIVGINVFKDIYILANIVDVEVDYFLTNSKEYFTSKASDNKLVELSVKGKSPKYSSKISATFLGIYNLTTNGSFKESVYSINKYTPKLFQKVLTFDFKCIESVYGINNDTQNGIELGTFLYPKYSTDNIFDSVILPLDSFNSHTLISGVTGAGKSRIASLIVRKIGSSNGHVSIIDPHNEYFEFLADLPKCSICKYYINSSHEREENSKIKDRPLTFSAQNFVAPILVKLLPELSEQQQNYIYESFVNIHSNGKQPLKKLIDNIVRDFNSNFIQDYPRYERVISEAQEYAKADFKNYQIFINRYVSFIGSNINQYKGTSKTKMIFAVLKKLIGIYGDNLFPIKEPSWQNSNNRNAIHILNIDYDANENIRRFINAILQSFLTMHGINSIHRVLVIDEAHLLLRENSLTTRLLTRLLRESRKLGLSIVFITQNEEDVSEEIRSQFQNRFRFREETKSTLKYLPNQTCTVSMFGSKLDFSMRINSIYKENEIPY